MKHGDKLNRVLEQFPEDGAGAGAGDGDGEYGGCATATANAVTMNVRNTLVMAIDGILLSVILPVVAMGVSECRNS